MACVRDQWTRSVKRADGSTARLRNERWAKGKRWLAGRVDPAGRQRTKAFSTNGPAERHANAIETDGSVGSTSIRKPGRFGSGKLRSGGWPRGWWIRLR